MSKNILKALPELIEAGIINEETAGRISRYYQQKQPDNNDRLFTAFGILGAILVGLGLILIIAHNWDNFPKTTKTGFAFLPLLISQALCLFAYYKRPDNRAWMESTSVLLFFSVGTCLALISQVYHLPGRTADFVFSWMLLVLPIVYICRSSMVGLLYISGITYYTLSLGWWEYRYDPPYFYWLLLLAIVPHYYQLYRHEASGNFMTLHNWVIPLSLVVSLGVFTERYHEVISVAYAGLLGLFYQIGQLNFFKTHKTRNNGFLVLGSLGMVILLLISSFDGFWESYSMYDIIKTQEFVMACIFIGLASSLLFYSWGQQKVELMDLSYLLFVLIFLLVAAFSPLGMILSNLLALLLALSFIRKGAWKESLSLLNYGLAIFAILVACRFFDTYLSFVFRGILFLVVGLAFFGVNYWFMKKVKS